MANLTITARVDASPERTFAVFTDLRNAPAMVQGIDALEVLTDGPIGPGTRFRETRTMFGRPHSETMEIIAWDAPRSYTVGCDSCGTRYESRFTFRPDGAATVVELTFSATPVAFMAKLLSPLGSLMIGMCRKLFQKDLDQLKAVAEGRANPTHIADAHAPA